MWFFRWLNQQSVKLIQLFKNTQDATEKVELVILIRPVVVDEDTWKSELRRSNELLEKWYPQEQNAK